MLSIIWCHHVHKCTLHCLNTIFNCALRFMIVLCIKIIRNKMIQVGRNKPPWRTDGPLVNYERCTVETKNMLDYKSLPIYYSLMSDYSIKIFWFIHFLLSYICFILWWYRLLVLHGQSGCSFNHRICCCPVRSNINLLLCCPRRNGADKSCFCLSVVRHVHTE